MQGVSWSPDGARIALTINAYPTRRTCVISVAVGSVTCLASLDAVLSADQTAWTDAQHIFLCLVEKNASRLVAVDAASGAITELLSDGLRSVSGVSPDGRYVAFVPDKNSSRTFGRIYLLDLRTRNVIGPYGDEGVAAYDPTWSLH